MLCFVAIRVDRTRGGRSTYPFSYTLPAGITQMQNSNDASVNMVKQETQSDTSPPSPHMSNRLIPPLLQVCINPIPNITRFCKENETTDLITL